VDAQARAGARAAAEALSADDTRRDAVLRALDGG
jgi:hypothetical protein